MQTRGREIARRCKKTRREDDWAPGGIGEGFLEEAASQMGLSGFFRQQEKESSKISKNEKAQHNPERLWPECRAEWRARLGTVLHA